MRRLLSFCLTALACLTVATTGRAETTCGAIGNPCAVPLGSYQAVAPADWNGARPLGLLLFFHGYGSSGESPLRNETLLQLAAERNLLLVAPNGVPGRPDGPTSWAHGGSPSTARDELTFTDQVLADVAQHWPLDAGRRFVSGFSQGGSMAWDIACYRGEAFTGFAPIAGAFWDPLPEDCPAGPVALRHVHGTSDGVVPMEGRPIGQQWHQGDVLASVARLRVENACAAEPDAIQSEGPLTCEIWTSCGSGKPLALCLHPGGHAFQADWVAEGIDWLETGE
ncbi:MAG: alpha/beta hydrolase-fold protein [Pseudomonadota bacterium]